jgi:hypothetical protein
MLFYRRRLSREAPDFFNTIGTKQTCSALS